MLSLSKYEGRQAHLLPLAAISRKAMTAIRHSQRLWRPVSDRAGTVGQGEDSPSSRMKSGIAGGRSGSKVLWAISGSNSLGSSSPR